MQRLFRFLKRKTDSFCFWLKHISSIKIEVFNSCAIHMAKSSRVDFYSRLFVFDPQKGSRIDIAENVWIGRNVEIQARNGQKISMGNKVSIQDNCKIIGDVSIGDYCTLAPNVYLSSTTHQFMAQPELPIKKQDELFPAKSEPIVIEEDVWLGINVFVKNGVHIGRGAIVGSNAVVLKNIEPYAIYGGIPAKKIGERKRS
jgi:acetyltransferase-like isoleucine patch superfamily enzyme